MCCWMKIRTKKIFSLFLIVIFLNSFRFYYFYYTMWCLYYFAYNAFSKSSHIHTNIYSEYNTIIIMMTMIIFQCCCFVLLGFQCCFRCYGCCCKFLIKYALYASLSEFYFTFVSGFCILCGKMLHYSQVKATIV